MANQFTAPGDLNGFTYEIYDKLVKPVPDSAKLVKSIPFKGGALELGNKLHVNVVVADEGGFSYAAPNAGAFTTTSGISLETQDAQVDGYNMLMESSLSYEMAQRASSSRKAFAEIAGEKMQNVVLASKRRLEAAMIYGQKGIGATASSANIDANNTAITFTAATWAPHLWIGKRNSKVVFYNAGGTTSKGNGNPFTITSVNVGSRIVKVYSATGADITQLDTDIAAGSCDCYFSGSATGSAGTFANAEMAGIVKIAGNTGTLFNINAATYPDTWAGNTLAVGSKALTFKYITDGAAQLADRGMTGDLDIYVSNPTWSNLANDQAALRRYGAEIREAKNGAESIVFYHQTGKMTVNGHGYIKAGDALMLDVSRWKRIGARDFSFKTPGLPDGEDIWYHDPSKAGFTWRYYCHQAAFCEMPSHQLYFSGIVNS